MSEAASQERVRERRLTGVPLLVVALAVVLLVQALFVLSYIDALHQPRPHDVALGVVGASPLPVAVGKQFSLKTTGAWLLPLGTANEILDGLLDLPS